MKKSFFIEKIELASKTCGYCGKVFTTHRGQKIHTTKKHKGEFRGLGIEYN